MNDSVKVHYHGTFLNGDKFDSSYDRNQPMRFTVGKKSVIKCWDEGLIGLKVGEKADLVCPPEYAYGSRQMGSIPPNTPLLFSVEVVSIEVKYEPPKPKEVEEGLIPFTGNPH